MKKAAQRDLSRLPREVQKRILTRLEGLAENPRPAGAEPLAGPVNLWRLRVGDYRIIYTIEDDVLLVLVLRMGHRREIYRLVLPKLELTAEEERE
ncbi:type II toxin-antitoxin system RelE/ParE family toxin [Acidobacteria bacterium ACD]|nr:type II toxin-antitoxin system RelE/ParE family toxin [Acidobacteria bacterium ACD]